MLFEFLAGAARQHLLESPLGEIGHLQLLIYTLPLCIHMYRLLCATAQQAGQQEDWKIMACVYICDILSTIRH